MLAIELWAVRAVDLADDAGGRIPRSTIEMRDEPEYGQMLTGPLHLPNRWAALDVINLALCEFVCEQERLVAQGSAPRLDRCVLEALADTGCCTVRGAVERLGIDVVTVPLSEVREEMVVRLDLGFPGRDGRRPLLRELLFSTCGAPYDRTVVLRRQAARVLWRHLGGDTLVGAEVVPDPERFIRRIHDLHIPSDRRFLSAPKIHGLTPRG